MKILVMSDAHANIWALKTVIETEKDYDYLVFAGDMVDYGTEPVQVMEFFQNAQNAFIVQGNHDLHAVRTAHTVKIKQIPNKQYKWIHYNLERMNDVHIEYLNALPKNLCFSIDGWAYLVQHQYIDGTYETIENRYQFLEFWKCHTPEEYWHAPKKRMIFGHSHRQCIHILGDGMEWINPGSISYRRPDDPDKQAQYMVIEDGIISIKSAAYDRHPLYEEAMKQLKEGRMMDTEIQDFLFFFGDAKSSREPLSVL